MENPLHSLAQDLEPAFDPSAIPWVRLGRTWEYHDSVTTDHPCRASRFQSRLTGDILATMRPLVFRDTGHLLLRAYTVVKTTGLKSAISIARFGKRFLLKSLTKSESPGHVAPWAISVSEPATDSYHKFHSELVVEVPNYNFFLCLTSPGQVPGRYQIASVCHLTLATDLDLQPLTSMKGREDQPHEDYMLLLRLVMFEPHELIFLQSLATILTNGPHTFLGPQATSCAQPSTIDMMQYSRWVECLKADPKSSLGPTSEGSISVFDSALKAVSRHLDAWSDSEIWDSIAQVLEHVQWSDYADRIKQLKREILFEIAAPIVNTPQAFHSALLDVNFGSYVEIWTALHSRVGQSLRELLHDLIVDVEQLGQTGLSGSAVYLGTFKLSETAEQLYQALGVVGSPGPEEIRVKQEDIFREWTGFCSHLRHMQWSRMEHVAIRDMFIQRQVLRRLYTRCELREFLIC